jgi:hypothetical protein
MWLRQYLPDSTSELIDHNPSFDDEMGRKGVAVFRWPELAREIVGNSDFRTKNLLSENLIALPAHQNINLKLLKKMV